MKLQILEQESQMLEQKIQEIDNQILELNAVKESLSEMEGKKEILANLGKGIFVNADVNDSRLLVNVGQGILIRKSAKETINVIEEQNKKLMQGKDEMIERMQALQEEAKRILKEAEKKHEHECSEECKEKHNH